MKIDFKRRKILVFPKFQLSLVFMVAFVNLMSLLIITHFVYGQFQDLMISMGVEKLGENSPFTSFIYELRNGTLARIIIGFIMATSISSIIALWLSHRFAGPMVRIRSYFEEIRTSGVRKGPIKFREGDYLNDLAPLIDEALQKLENQSKSG